MVRTRLHAIAKTAKAGATPANPNLYTKPTVTASPTVKVESGRSRRIGLQLER